VKVVKAIEGAYVVYSHFDIMLHFIINNILIANIIHGVAECGVIAK
jgi:hypothetical protein